MQMNPSTSMAAVPGTNFSGLANLMAMKGRGGDNTLVHMSKSELPYLNMLAKSAGYPQGLPVNPKTDYQRLTYSRPFYLWQVLY